jgi:hypothetical protein
MAYQYTILFYGMNRWVTRISQNTFTCKTLVLKFKHQQSHKIAEMVVPYLALKGYKAACILLHIKLTDVLASVVCVKFTTIKQYLKEKNRLTSQNDHSL